MQEIIERIKQVRQHLKLNQEDFADKLNLKRNSITLIETGRRNPSDRTLIDICREFNINEEWIRYGTGEMFGKLSRDQELAMSIGRILANENETAKNVFLALSKLDPSEWKVIQKLIDDLSKKNE